MKEAIFHLELIGFFLISLLGYLIHFGYNYINIFKKLPFIFAINESVWEHLKLVFWPSLIFSLIEFSFIGKFTPNFWIAKGSSLIIMPLFIIITFYTYTGIVGTHYIFIDILIFHISVLFGQFISFKLLTINPIRHNELLTLIFIIIIFTLTFIFIYFTYKPLNLPLFKE